MSECITSVRSHKFQTGTQCSLYNRKISLHAASVCTSSLSLEKVKMCNMIITDRRLGSVLFSFSESCLSGGKQHLSCPKLCANFMVIFSPFNNTTPEQTFNMIQKENGQGDGGKTDQQCARCETHTQFSSPGRTTATLLSPCLLTSCMRKMPL